MQQILSGRKGFWHLCDQPGKKKPHICIQLKKLTSFVKLQYNIKKKKKKETSDHEVCHLFADISVCLINCDKKLSQVHFIMQQCVITVHLEEGGVFLPRKMLRLELTSELMRSPLK